MVQVWKIAPGEGAEDWDLFREQGCIGLGWLELPDYHQYASEQDVLAALQGAYGRGTKGSSGGAAKIIWRFLDEVQPQHIVVANQGYNRVVGIGVVTSEYLAPGSKDNPIRNDETTHRHHVRRVNWLITDPVDLPGKRFFVQAALWPLENEKFNRIRQAYAAKYPHLTATLDQLLASYEAGISGSLRAEAGERPIVYFNNCHNRAHVALFGSGAFFDLGTTGRQGSQARNLHPGQPCVVAEWASDEQIVFDWYSFSYEALLPDEHGAPDRVFFGRLFASETLPKDAAAHSERYAALFRSNGHLKIGSVFHKSIAARLIPPAHVVGGTPAESDAAGIYARAGFGDPAENKLVESAAVRKVVKDYEANGWLVRSVERDKCGFDLECSKNGAVEHVEVKGVRGTSPCFIITAGEVEQARGNPKFFLVVVTSALSATPKVTKFSGAKFQQQFDLWAIQYRAVLRE
jgi:hypothetical protein